LPEWAFFLLDGKSSAETGLSGQLSPCRLVVERRGKQEKWALDAGAQASCPESHTVRRLDDVLAWSLPLSAEERHT